MTEKLALLLIAFITVMIVKILTGYDPIGVLEYNFGLLVSFLNGRSAVKKEKHKTKFNQMTAKEKKKNLKYRFYSFVNEIMLDMGWNTKSITVEGIVTLMKTVAIFVGILIWILMGSVLLALIIGFVFYWTAIAFLFLISRINHTRRKQALMDAEDIICANMGQGIVVAIETNIASFDPFITAPFKQFLDEIYNRNASVETALNNLNTNCGEQLDLFCDKAKTYEKERRPGMENVFQYNINRNAEIRILDRECAKAFTSMNRNYLGSLAILAGFIFFSFTQYQSVIDFYMSGFGKFLLTMYVVASAVVFIYIQYIQSKPFIYGEKGKIVEIPPAREYEDNTYTRTKRTQWVAAKVEPLSVRARKIMNKKKKDITAQDIEDLEAYKEELRKMQEES